MTKEQKEVCKECVKKYGVDSQINVAIEEMSELTKALCKWKRATLPADTMVLRDDVMEELVDVIIMTEQLKTMFSVSNEEMEAYIRVKINRQKERMDG